MNKLHVKGFVLAGVIAVLGLALPVAAFAGVDINMSIPLFGLFYDDRPPVAMYGYGAPADGSVFYGGYWYRPSGGNWFIAAQAGGPWAVIGIERVPYAVLSGPVLMEQPRSYGNSNGGSLGIVISPWFGIGRHGGGHGRGHDD